MNFKAYKYNFDRSIEDKIEENKEKYRNSDYLWTDFNFLRGEAHRAKGIAKEIERAGKTLVVAGIGGSFLGAEAAINALNPKGNKIHFIGNSLSTRAALQKLSDLDEDFALLVISKSGNTLETIIAYTYMREFMKNKFSDYNKRIFIMSQSLDSKLGRACQKNGHNFIEISSEVGGRYSVLTCVGLVSMAFVGIDVDKVIDGALSVNVDHAISYATYRNKFYEKNLFVEIFTVYEPDLEYLLKWILQLFAESEGKEGKGILPTYVINSRDLHSLGQYIQSGRQMFFETTISPLNSNSNLEVSLEDYGLNLNMTLNELNDLTRKAVMKSHSSNQLLLEIEKIDEFNLGCIFYFFEYACQVSAKILGVDPFNQPGVEEYKAILRKKLYEK